MFMGSTFNFLAVATEKGRHRELAEVAVFTYPRPSAGGAGRAAGSVPGGLWAATPLTVPMVAILKRRFRSPSISRVLGPPYSVCVREGCREA